jgi:predicted lipase
MTDPAPALPVGYSLVGAIRADINSVASLVAASPNQARIAQKMASESDIFGLVAWNAAEATAMAAIRGTKTFVDWIEDFSAVSVPYIPNPEFGTAHLGFQIVYEHIRQNLANVLMNGCQGAQRVLVTGHSLGAAVAILAGVDIAKNSVLRVTPELCTLAGPRVAAPDFAENFKALIPVCDRVVNFMDVVPQVPLPPLYIHVGQEVLVHGGFRPLDVTYAHHLSTYLVGLKKLELAQNRTVAATAQF